ncbi:cold-regulated 413 plasma membrane protein 4-like [Mercurialis annua]|uniref:cold-regulated 413 plasma membrane protein 4-like n=1 Tax=Mercurialis annua TaxID=3986 RepID=UPI00216093FB|nr:cold-regulated 413 plasma membrane protein 4-like [Mercurialis annua]
MHHHFIELLRSNKATESFQWGGTISSIFLLILNWTGRRSALPTTLLTLYLFTSFPTVFFEILRGQFGYWIAFLAVAANLFFPETFPVSRFILFVVIPEWLANGLRNSIAGVILCLILLVSLGMVELQETGQLRSRDCNMRCFFYGLGLACLFLFTVLSLHVVT